MIDTSTIGLLLWSPQEVCVTYCEGFKVEIDALFIKPLTIKSLIQKVMSTVDNWNRRKSERHEIEGPVTIQFGSHHCRKSH